MLFFIQFPHSGLKPLSNDDIKEEKAAESSLNYKLSTESQRKIKDFETKEIQQTRNSEALCMDTYKNVDAPKVSQMKPDLFSGLNQTVKVLPNEI